MTLSALDRRSKILLLIAFLVVSIASSRRIPFLDPWGADLHNILVYQKCAAGGSPYDIKAAACGDQWERDFYYPPLLYHSFRWTRSLSSLASRRVWTIFQVIAMAGACYAFARGALRARSDGDRWEIALFGGLLLLQYPFVFSLERGCTDVWAVLFVTASSALLARCRFALAGIALGVAAAYKLYPVFAAIVVVPGLLVACWQHGFRPRARFPWLRAGAGAALSFLAISLCFFRLSRQYFFHVLPVFAAASSGQADFSHSLPALVGEHPAFTRILFASLLGVWIWAAGRAFARGDVKGPVAGALACSTYLQATSWDYNLVTTYPLLIVMFLRARHTDRWGVLGLGLLAIIGERALFSDTTSIVFAPVTHVALQLAFLTAAAVVVATSPPPPELEDKGDHDARQPAPPASV